MWWKWEIKKKENTEKKILEFKTWTNEMKNEIESIKSR